MQSAFPFCLSGFKFGGECLQLFFESCDLGLPAGCLLFLLRRIDFEERAFVPAVCVSRVIKEREEPEILFLRDRVVLVAVALGAGDRRAHPHGHRRVHPVHDGDVAELLVVGAAFVVRQCVPMKRRRDELFVRGVGQQIARDLFDGKLIEGLVGVQRANHIIAVGPDRAGRIVRIARGVGIAGKIQPHPRPMLAETFLGQQPIHQLLVSIGAFVVDEFLDLGERGRQTGEVQRQPPNQGGLIRARRRPETFLFQPGQEETIDFIPRPGGVFHRGQCRPLGFDVGPMLCIVRPFADPAFEEFDLPRAQFFPAFGRRHFFARVRGFHPADEFAFARLAAHDYGVSAEILKRPGFVVEPEPVRPALAFGFVRAVAFEAFVGEDRPDVAGKIDGLRGFGRNRRGPHHTK